MARASEPAHGEDAHATLPARGAGRFILGDRHHEEILEAAAATRELAGKSAPVAQKALSLAIWCILRKPSDGERPC